MKFSLRRVFASTFNDETSVRAGLVAGAAVMALGLPFANMLHDKPSDTVVDPVAATAQRNDLAEKFGALKAMERNFRATLQEKAFTGDTIPQEDIDKIAESHVAFTKRVLFSREISEKDYGSIRADYTRSFGDTYGYVYKYKTTDRNGVPYVAERKLSFDNMGDVASFKECQNKYIVPELLAAPVHVMESVGNCLYNPNGQNILFGFSLFGVAALSIAAGFNTRTLRNAGQRLKDRIDAQDRLAAEEAQKEAANPKPGRMVL